MKEVKQAYLSGERALFNSDGIRISDSVFADGESPLKESKNVEVKDSIFKWKYPFWYCTNVNVEDTTLLETARSGIWYTNNITMKNCMVASPKTFRRGSHITLENVNMPNAQETLWMCKDITIKDSSAKGDYFGMNSEDITLSNFHLCGNYSFDGGKNITVHDSTLISKDAFWNCENVTVYDSTIIGEYLGWNSKNITFVNCTIESLQGLCYMENVTMVNCKLINTTLAFEYSSVKADINSSIDSVMNPTSGEIKAQAIKELIMEEDKIDPSKTIITTKE